MALGLDGFAGVLNRVKTPLTLAGLALLIFYGVVSRILGLGIFSQLQESNTATILGQVLSYTFILALVCIVLGVASFLVTSLTGSSKEKRPKKR
jgi:uncharacterized membrane protein